MNKENTQVVSLRLPNVLRKNLKHIAVNKDITLATLLREILADYVEADNEKTEEASLLLYEKFTKEYPREENVI